MDPSNTHTHPTEGTEEKQAGGGKGKVVCLQMVRKERQAGRTGTICMQI